MTELLVDTRPQRAHSVESNDLADGVVLYDSSSEVAHHLNPVATLVWELCDGRTVGDIVDAVAEVLEIPTAEAQSVVVETYGQLNTSRLLV
ncbi:PqqD family protein [Rhodococcus sp. ACPA4]|uniref:Coenzyme PQQ synthesis protein D (PqqD) n=1 Tax=Nocardia globerula TaxID=1818 RepID=A0A652YMQ8_NOCGL|nr:MULTISPECIES: PqqD family protein [Rhodococcus]NMD62351.1 PqqD family protein [Nocardia globerula]MCE4263736.1 PqqD family protein [Rhodococcus globerulus]NRI64618.1 PqqD family protein [Rhodococcus sp. MS16]PBC41124.1 PqqD family protein [Rhodococcus sp. ACPA4]PVX65553.1 coenzyme PQQ synthesis protein D (PqqD) [Rhodococcus globerulus]